MDLENMMKEEGERILSTALNDGSTPDLTFGSILNQITHFLKDYPEEERSSRRKKLMCVLEKKFSALLKTDKESSVLDVERKRMLTAVADKIAAWMEGVIVEAESRMDSQCTALQSSTATAGSGASSTVKSVSLQPQESDVYEVMRGSGSYFAVENRVRPRAQSEDRSTMTDLMVSLRAWEALRGPEEGEADMRKWADWIESVTRMAEDWASWINQTVTQAKLKAAMKKGEVVTSEGSVEKLTRTDWNSWTRKINREASNFTRVNQNIQKTAEEWSRTFADSIKNKKRRSK